MIRALTLAAMMAGPAAAFDVSNMDEAERRAFGDAVRTYILENPEVLMEAMSILEEREAAAQAEADAALVAANRDALVEDGHSFVGGNPDGSVTVVEFLDYRCGYCRRAHPEVAELLSSDGDIRLVVKELPILGEQSMLASRFAISVLREEGPEAYKAVNDALMTWRGDIDMAALAAIADDASLEFEAIAAGMDGRAVTRVIAENRALAQTLGINGTPSFVFGDRMVRGYLPLGAMEEIVAAEREG